MTTLTNDTGERHEGLDWHQSDKTKWPWCNCVWTLMKSGRLNTLIIYKWPVWVFLILPQVKGVGRGYGRRALSKAWRRGHLSFLTPPPQLLLHSSLVHFSSFFHPPFSPSNMSLVNVWCFSLHPSSSIFQWHHLPFSLSPSCWTHSLLSSPSVLLQWLIRGISLAWMNVDLITPLPSCT